MFNQKKKIILSVVAVLTASLLVFACSSPTGGGGTPGTPVVFESVVQTGGASGVSDTTGLILTFDVEPTTLTAANITVTGATKGTLSGTGTTRTLSISNIRVNDGETVSVRISNPSGFSLTGSPKTVTVHKLPEVNFVSAVQSGGTDETADSTGLTLTFDVDPDTLTAANITVTGATKGALSGTGTTRSLSLSDITVDNGETVSVSISSPSGFSLSGSPKTAVIYREVTAVAFQSATQIGGTSQTTDTTGLTLTFDVDPTELTVDEITVTGATKGTLSGTGTTRVLSISDITVHNGETVSVSIENPVATIISGSPQTAVVYRAPYAGMPYLGGVIGYIFESGDTGYVAGETHGLIVSSEDLGLYPWIEGGTTQTTALGATTSLDLGKGQANTNAMLSHPEMTGGAAKVCDDYINTDTGTGVYDDWYLPSFFELVKIKTNKTIIGNFSTLNQIYWCSSEWGIDTAKYVNFYFIASFDREKNLNGNVRAVRSF